jgi:hypothetical protein
VGRAIGRFGSLRQTGAMAPRVFARFEADAPSQGWTVSRGSARFLARPKTYVSLGAGLCGSHRRAVDQAR